MIETDVNPVSTTDDNIAASSDIIDIEQLNRVLSDHDYISVVPTTDDKLDAAVAEVDRLKYIIDTYNMERFSIERYIGSPDLLNFYTGFSNHQTLKKFYCTLAPSASTMIAWTQFRRSNVRVCDFRDSCSSTALPLIDQFFLVLTRLRTGMLEMELADRCNISQSTISRSLIGWLNYLYFFLGSVPIWPSRNDVDKHMPEIFKPDYILTRVVIDCTELYVQKPAS